MGGGPRGRRRRNGKNWERAEGEEREREGVPKSLLDVARAQLRRHKGEADYQCHAQSRHQTAHSADAAATECFIGKSPSSFCSEQLGREALVLVVVEVELVLDRRGRQKDGFLCGLLGY